MITIEQLLEFVDLDFEPRWVTKDKDGWIGFWKEKPTNLNRNWFASGSLTNIGLLKLAEFANKPWTECIYEVPRKTDEYEQNLEKTRPADSDLVYRVKLPRKDKPVVKIEKLQPTVRGFDEVPSMPTATDFLNKINELVDAVNELKGAKNR